MPPERNEHWRKYLGRKISIRYRLDGDPQHPFSEAIGVVASVSPDNSTIEIITRRAGTVTLDTAAVIAGKVFH